MTAFFALLVMSAVITATVDYLAMIWDEGEIHWKVGLSIVFGIATSWAFQLSLFDVLGIKAAIPVLDYLLTGILISRGSNWFYDFLSQLLKYKNGSEVE